MYEMPQKRSNILINLGILIGAPLFILIFFYAGSFFITDTIFDAEPQNITIGNSTLNTGSNNSSNEVQTFVQTLGAGIAIFIFFAILFAYAVRKNIYG